MAILYFWLVNLLIAVITSSFQVIREEGKVSAFTGEENDNRSLDEDEEGQTKSKKSTLIRLFRKTKWIWVLIIAADLVVQAVLAPRQGRGHLAVVQQVLGGLFGQALHTQQVGQGRLTADVHSNTMKGSRQNKLLTLGAGTPPIACVCIVVAETLARLWPGASVREGNFFLA